MNDEVQDLEKQLAQEHDALSTSDCTVACQALGSIKRAADRICALTPDERCTSAQAKAKADTQKVHDACPTCANAAMAPIAPAPVPAPPMNVSGESAKVEPGSRGCGSCDAGGVSPSDFTAIGVAVVGVWLTRGRWLSRYRRSAQKR